MIKVDESDPIGDTEPSLPYNDVTIKKGADAKEFYDLIEEIGRGKFGTVYKCREKSTGLELAAKFIPIPKRDDRRNVEREVEIMNSLQHPKIIQIYDAYEFSKNMWVIQELIEGGELFERVIDENFLLTEKACTVIIRQVCEAVEFIHRQHILHLDLKPENILMLTREGNRVKIIDFGLARKYDPDKKLQVLFGTPEFVAPEVLNFDTISYGTDMWSLGVICYVLLSGLSPFMGETDIETMTNVTISKYDYDDEAFNDVSPEAIDFITKLLVKDINGRITAVEALEHKWLKRKIGRPNLAPKPVKIPPPKFINPLTSDSENNIELEKTKENLKEFVERWGEHPNSPYVFDRETNYIAPLQNGIKANSNLSSRGCSPSPCESLTSTNDRETETETAITTEPIPEVITNGVITPEVVVEVVDEEPEKVNGTNMKNMEDYLHTFDRRNSDSKCVVKETGTMEKISLADEIRKLSDRLLMFSKINVDLGTSENEIKKDLEMVNEISPEVKPNITKLEPSVQSELPVEPTYVEKPVTEPISEPEPIIPQPTVPTTTKETLIPIITETPKRKPELKKKPENVKPKLNECFNRAISLVASDKTETNLSNGNTVINKSSSINASSVNAVQETRSSHRFSGSFDENRVLNTRLSSHITNGLDASESSSANRRSTFQSSRDSIFSQTFGANTATSAAMSPSWQFQGRRTKFRINQASRDVPLASFKSKSSFIMDNSATATKDCLLQLLEKYSENRDIKSSLTNIGRHQSISGEWGLSDSLESRSMNSINAFFHRHSTRGTAVKQIQAQMESRHK